MIEDIAGNDAVRLPHAVTVVIPAFNEGAHVADQVREVERVLATTGWTYEIIVVDDGSRDNTAEEADRTGALVLRRLRNRGYGAALKLGISRAAHPWILITDADGTYPVEAIPGLLAEADANEMVIGGRLGANVNIPLARRPAKWFLNKLAGYLAGQPLPDINSGLRLMRRSLVARYEHLLPEGFSFTTTITMSAACNGHAFIYVPIDYHARLGQSKIRPRHALDFTILILRTIVFFNPLKVFLPVGAMLFVAGVAKFIFDITRDNLSESAVLGIIGALVVWAVGLLADQNMRIARRS
ncbi:MAG: glycosyltransferase family 2 protein [Gemmatimonadales bacterium]|nr:glycosyltransferase family 2 protein [Gemmatimonadales bacterium]